MQNRNSDERKSLKKEQAEKKRVLRMQQQFMLAHLKEKVAAEKHSRSESLRNDKEGKLLMNNLRELCKTLSGKRAAKRRLQCVKAEMYVSKYESRLAECGAKINTIKRKLGLWKANNADAKLSLRRAVDISLGFLSEDNEEDLVEYLERFLAT